MTGDDMEAIPKQYNPIETEAKWQRFWLREDIYEKSYKFIKEDENRHPFVIDTPPPFTSGELHMGHAYWNIINDSVARYKRMRGYNVLLPQGWDCQGLPTELKVQNNWNVPKEDRDYFRLKCVEWTEEMIARMKATMIKLGYRPDWKQFEYRTMDQSYWRKVQSTLLTFLEKGLIYRDLFPVHWCPSCETALAQAELGYIERRDYLYYLRFSHDKGFVEVATTRPELLPACQALAVHPEDKRHSQLVGMSIRIPLYDRRIPVIVDEDVEPEFGTGVVMVCTFGDEQDIKWQQKHGLPVSKVINEHGNMVNSGKYSGISVSEAREVVVHDLEKKGHISKREKITHKILSHTERSDCLSPIEFLVKSQFFIKIRDLGEGVKKACGEMKWIPEHYFKRLVDWVDSIEWDWVISRQRLYGTPLPFWYCENCNYIIPARREQLPVDPPEMEKPVEVCPECESQSILACEDVCDCWVDSSITPLIISGRLEQEEHAQRAYPASVRQQGHDIIRTWLYYTTLRCLTLTGEKPFLEVVVNGHVLGPDGYRMSKSRGNVVNPEDKIGEYAADSIRQALLSLTLGSDFAFNWESVKYCRGFLQKYWSALRFSRRFIEEKIPSNPREGGLTIIDKWILHKLGETLRRVTKSLDQYQFHTAISNIQDFFWHDFCDQYLEAVKHRLYESEGDESYDAARNTLNIVLWNTTLCLAPICPHITEEVYHILWSTEEEPTIHALQWPDFRKIPMDEEAEGRGSILIDALTKIRTEKGKAGIPLSREVEEVVLTAPPKMLDIIMESRGEVNKVLHIKKLRCEKGEFLKARVINI